MSYNLMKRRLIREFNENEDIWLNYINKEGAETHTNEFIIDEDRELVITYPGYKTTKRGKKIIYDYKVNYQGHAISHPSIIIDLYSKAIQYPHTANRLKEFLIKLSKAGDNINLEEFEDLANLEYSGPSEEILDIANDTFRELKKSYLITGNRPWNFSFEDLAFLISWISLQEDINYPMTIKSFQGRMMPFYRYIEAIYSVVNKKDKYSLKKVIKRSLKHSKPNLWEPIDYSEISNLKYSIHN
jgi:hypothetical protein